MKDYYSLLRISQLADQKKIDEAWEKFCRESLSYIPGGVTGDRNDWMRTQFPDHFEAYTVLSDPEKRKAYDAVFSASAERKSNLPPNGKLLLKYEPLNHKRKFWLNFYLIGGLLIIVLDSILFLLYNSAKDLKGVRSNFLSDINMSQQEFEWLMLTCFIAGLFIAALRFISNPVYAATSSVREIIATSDGIFVLHQNGKADRVKEIRYYEQLIRRTEALSVFTDNGKRISVNRSISSPYVVHATKEDFVSSCEKLAVKLKLKPGARTIYTLHFASAENSKTVSKIMHTLSGIVLISYMVLTYFLFCASLIWFVFHTGGMEIFGKPVFLTLFFFSDIINRLLLLGNNAADRMIHDQ